MEFEYDPNKSNANKRKHGIDFEEAAALWNDPRALVPDLVFPQEIRYGLIASVGDPTKLWVAIFTLRSDKIRIISVRRARADERELYEQGQSEEC